MAQYYSVPGHSPPQDVQYPTPSAGCRQTYHSPMSPPPYPGDYHEFVPMPCKTDYYKTTQYTHTYSNDSHRQPMAIQQSSSHQPIVIPQTAPGGNNPFTRAYSPVLSTHNISLSTFLSFLDTLNICLANTPPLQILDLAGGFVGMVPHHIPALIGTSLQATAKVAGAITSKTRVAKLLNSSNAEVFAPQGLRVELVDTETLKQKLGIEGGRPLLGGLDERGSDMSVRDRRLHALDAYIAPLEFDVPEPARQENAIDRLSASQLKRQMAKAEEKAIEARRKENEKKNKKAEKEDRKAEKDKKKGKERKEKREKDDKESKAAEKLLWLYIGQL
ncbi:unnamed protein product [Aureobasidium mustum]|uniref:Uncharacterized protein n=1 Tax=Aureobasidium mustum TaxID=2773714 RepID=A0A9N8PM37_9PEZI|nr:unnamed protein product [Aureobasidium mustum]